MEGPPLGLLLTEYLTEHRTSCCPESRAGWGKGKEKGAHF